MRGALLLALLVLPALAAAGHHPFHPGNDAGTGRDAPDNYPAPILPPDTLGAGTYHGNITYADLADEYLLDVPAGVVVRVHVAGSHALQASLADPTRAPRADDWGAPGVPAILSAVGLPAGLWTLRVASSHLYVAPPTVVAYTFTVEFEVHEHHRIVDREGSALALLASVSGGFAKFEMRTVYTGATDGLQALESFVLTEDGELDFAMVGAWAGEGVPRTIFAHDDGGSRLAVAGPSATTIAGAYGGFFHEHAGSATFEYGYAGNTALSLRLYVVWDGELDLSIREDVTFDAQTVADARGNALTVGPYAASRGGVLATDLPAGRRNLLFVDGETPYEAVEPTRIVVARDGARVRLLEDWSSFHGLREEIGGTWTATIEQTNGFDHGRPRLLAASFPLPIHPR